MVVVMVGDGKSGESEGGLREGILCFREGGWVYDDVR